MLQTSCIRMRWRKRYTMYKRCLCVMCLSVVLFAVVSLTLRSESQFFFHSSENYIVRANPASPCHEQQHDNNQQPNNSTDLSQHLQNGVLTVRKKSIFYKPLLKTMILNRIKLFNQLSCTVIIITYKSITLSYGKICAICVTFSTLQNFVLAITFFFSSEILSLFSFLVFENMCTIFSVFSSFCGLK